MRVQSGGSFSWATGKDNLLLPGERKCSFFLGTMSAFRCETYVRVLPSWLPNSTSELGFLNTFSQLTTCNLNDECVCRSRHPLPQCCMPTCPRTLLKEAIQWNLEEFYLTASQCPKVRRQIRVKRINFSSPWGLQRNWCCLAPAFQLSHNPGPYRKIWRIV